VNNIDKIYCDDFRSFAKDYLSYLGEIFQKIYLGELQHFVNLLLNARANGSRIFFIGNGGSAATSSHFANDLSIGTAAVDKPFRVISLVDNVPVMTALANDFGYEEVFSRQLAVLGENGDLLVGISASGNSPNCIKAFELAKTMGIFSVSLTSFDGGKLRRIADHNVHVPTEPREYGPAEDIHMIFDHLITAYLMRQIASQVK
jgi:D-sedoheptulose 7-phosphate isomerase